MALYKSYILSGLLYQETTPLKEVKIWGGGGKASRQRRTSNNLDLFVFQLKEVGGGGGGRYWGGSFAVYVLQCS
jgi:hypothetical protein